MDFMGGPLSGERTGWRAAVNGSVSKWKPVMGGIPQGLLLRLVILKSQQQGNELCSQRAGKKGWHPEGPGWGYVNLTIINNFKSMLLHKSIPSTNIGWSENVEIMLQIMFCWKNYF